MKKLTNYEKYYFTFGTGKSMPLTGGWVLVLATSREQAVEEFRQYFPDSIPGLLNCCTYYNEKEFSETSLFLTSDNCGAALHQIIIPDGTYISSKDRVNFDSNENCLLQNCMECNNLFPSNSLHWLNDMKGIPYKKTCESCDPKVTEQIYNMFNYEGYECIDAY